MKEDVSEENNVEGLLAKATAAASISTQLYKKESSESCNAFAPPAFTSFCVSNEMDVANVNRGVHCTALKFLDFALSFVPLSSIEAQKAQCAQDFDYSSHSYHCHSVCPPLLTSSLLS